MGMVDLIKAVIPQKLRTPLKYRVYSQIPLDKRMGKEYWQLKAFLQEAQWWDREFIEVWQLERLKKIVRYAYENVPGYKSLYQEAGVRPDDINSLADVKLLPFTTKELLRDDPKEFMAQNIPFWKRRYVTTGGSTGTPFGFYHTDTSIWMENAFMHNGWERVGWQLGDMSAVLRGNFKGSQEQIWEYDPSRSELLLSSYYLMECTYKQYITILEKFSPKYLQAYPSTATLLSDLITRFGDVGRIDFEIILLGSENIYEWQKVALKQAFPKARVFGWYGHTEQTILAPICENSDQYHIWPFYGLTEMVNEENENIKEDEIGELVGTSFWSYGTPFIRYRTEDLAQRGPVSCNVCKRQFNLIRSIEGRKQDFVVTKDGGYVTLTALIFAQHFHAFGAIKNMQLYQDRVGEVLVKVVPTGSFSEQDSIEIKTKMEAAVGGRLKVQIMLLDEISRTQRGKYRLLDQKLDIKYGN